LAEAKSVDEAKHILDFAAAMKAYARQARNKDLEADAFEIRVRAERRLGGMMAAQKEQFGTAQGRRTDLGFSKTQVDKATLQEAGIDKNLAHRARQLHAMSSEAFEAMVSDGREEARRSAERAVISKINRQEKHQDIATKAKAGCVLAHTGPFPLIYADPPWKWGHFGEPDQENERGKARTPDQHYPTLTYDEIKEFRVGGKSVREIAHEDAALLMWCTSANIQFALEVMEAWGFTYKSHVVWVHTTPEGKPLSGLGLVFRNTHDVLLYGVRGKMPGPQYQPPSAFLFPRGRHSAKPPEIRQEIERMYPDFKAAMRLELFARETVPAWSVHGFEAQTRAGTGDTE
jgi:N6-adenosine-specific RNA methylase IME4